MTTLLVEHSLADLHLAKISAGEVGADARAALRALTYLLFAEATRKVTGQDVVPIIVPLSPRGAEMAAMSMPLFGNVNLGFAAPAPLDAPDEHSRLPYLPAVIPGGMAILVDDYVSGDALERIEVAATTLMTRGASDVRLACLRASMDVLDLIHRRDLPVDIITFSVRDKK